MPFILLLAIRNTLNCIASCEETMFWFRHRRDGRSTHRCLVLKSCDASSSNSSSQARSQPLRLGYRQSETGRDTQECCPSPTSKPKNTAG